VRARSVILGSTGALVVLVAAGCVLAGAALAAHLGNFNSVNRALAPGVVGAILLLLAQLGYAYPYGGDGNGGPALLDELGWGAHAGESGRLAAPEPLFPRLEADPADG
jgi:hypothetical protein